MNYILCYVDELSFIEVDWNIFVDFFSKKKKKEKKEEKKPILFIKVICFSKNLKCYFCPSYSCFFLNPNLNSVYNSTNRKKCVFFKIFTFLWQSAFKDLIYFRLTKRQCIMIKTGRIIIEKARWSYYVPHCRLCKFPFRIVPHISKMEDRPTF